MYPVEQWFQVRDPRYYIGYLPAEKQAFARLDNLGFQRTIRSAGSFARECRRELRQPGYPQHLRRVGGEVRLSGPPGDPAADHAGARPGLRPGERFRSSGQTYVQVVGVALPKMLAVYNEKGKLITQLPYQQDVERWGEILFGINLKLDRFYLRYQPSAWIDAKTRKTMPSYIHEMDAQGQVLRTYELAPLPSFSCSPAFSTLVDRRLRCPAFFYGEMLYRKIGAMLGSERLARLNEQWGTGRKVTMEIITWSTSLSAFLALCTLFWARSAQYSWKRAWSWSAFVLLFNLAGLITFWLASDWPRLVACAKCRRRRPIDTASCPSCGATGRCQPSPASKYSTTQNENHALEGTAGELQVGPARLCLPDPGANLRPLHFIARRRCRQQPDSVQRNLSHGRPHTAAGWSARPWARCIYFPNSGQRMTNGPGSCTDPCLAPSYFSERQGPAAALYFWPQSFPSP